MPPMSHGPIAHDDPKRFFNRELSWIAFNRRVLEEASNTRHPLLERLCFLAICASNMDEFIAVRVASIEDLQARHDNARSIDGRTPEMQLKVINDALSKLISDMQTAWHSLRHKMADEGIILVNPEDLNADEHHWLDGYFTDNVLLALTPLAADPLHAFPSIPNCYLALAVRLQSPQQATPLINIVPLPTQLKRFIRLPASKDGSVRFVALETVIQRNLHRLFPDSTILDAASFKVIRDSEIHLDEVANRTDFVRSFESAIQSRTRGAVLRLLITEAMPQVLRQALMNHMNVSPEHIVVLGDLLRYADLRQMAVRDNAEWVYPEYEPRFPERIREYNDDCFAAIGKKDIIVHHPYETFDVVLNLLRQAANDPNVVAIKQTLYRTSKDSPIVRALIEAAEAGKSVTAMVELKARFDEEANLRWARDLEHAGAQVVFGFRELKTHTKMTLIIRQEENVLRSYAHFGTGNYHPDTARVYADLSFFTSDYELCQDAMALFNYTTGYAKPGAFFKLSVAPLTLRSTLYNLIAAEIAHAKDGKPAHIWAKLNTLSDPGMIDRLYSAAQKGVQIDLVVRGSCCLRPGVPGLSENIRVKSIIGRFLEHSRIFAFGNGHALPSDHAKVFISTADWMTRNLDRRIETLVPIENETVRRQLLEQIMVANFKDTRQSWILMPDGSYNRAINPEEDFSAHEYFMTNPSLSGRGEGLRKKHPPPKLSLKHKT